MFVVRRSLPVANCCITTNTQHKSICPKPPKTIQTNTVSSSPVKTTDINSKSNLMVHLINNNETNDILSKAASMIFSSPSELFTSLNLNNLSPQLQSNTVQQSNIIMNDCGGGGGGRSVVKKSPKNKNCKGGTAVDVTFQLDIHNAELGVVQLAAPAGIFIFNCYIFVIYHQFHHQKAHQKVLL